MISASGVVPNKDSLLLIATRTVLDIVSPEIRELYVLMEKEFNLMSYSIKIDSIIKYLENSEYK